MSNTFLIATLLLIMAVIYTEGFVPSQYLIFANPTAGRSVNGSSATGLCTDSTTTMNSFLFTCQAPASSVLFDGNVPALVGLDGDMWASQILTTELEVNSQITFDFSNTPGFDRVDTVELIMFNCPEWGITMRKIDLVALSSFDFEGGGPLVSGINNFSSNVTSCNSFVSYCLNFRQNTPFLRLSMFRDPLVGDTWAHIAEIIFHRGTTCTPTPPTETTAATLAPSTTSSITTTPPDVTPGAIPSRYFIVANPVAGRSVNGSLASGQCTDTTTTNPSAFSSILTCAAPASSVLFDGSIPALVGLDGNMWASQLQTTELQLVSTFVFDLSSSQDLNRVDTVEIVMFNCPEWGITARSISLVALRDFAFESGGPVTDVIEISSNISSCDSFVRFCLNYRRSSPFLRLNFNRDRTITSNTWAHVAEIIFHRGTTCTPSTPTPPPMETTASTSFESTTSTNDATSATTDVPTTITTSVITDPMSTTTEPTGSLFFMFNGQRLPSGSSLLISDIGATRAGSVLDLGSALACVTSEVNTQCCRNRDGGNVGEWFFPDGSMVPRNRGNQNADFTRSGFTHQIRLNRRNDAAGPEGTYTCRVPDATDSSVIHSATITLESFRPLPRRVQCFVVVCVWQGPAEGSLEDYAGYEIRFGGQVVFQHENDEFFHVVNGDPRILVLGAPQDVTVEVRVSSIGNDVNPWSDPVPLSSI